MGKVKFRRNTQTTREMRRLGERERAREQRMKDADAFLALSPEERRRRLADSEAVRRMCQNGITLEDLIQTDREARQVGYNEGKTETLTMCYAAFLLALKEVCGFEPDRCMEILNAADEKVTYTLSSADAIKEVYDEMGLKLNFAEALPGERIQEVLA